MPRQFFLGGDLLIPQIPVKKRQRRFGAFLNGTAHSDFFAVCGNHDPFGITEFYSSPPENLYIFPDKIKGVDLGGITVFGISLSSAFNMPDPWKGFGELVMRKTKTVL